MSLRGIRYQLAILKLPSTLKNESLKTAKRLRMSWTDFVALALAEKIQSSQTTPTPLRNRIKRILSPDDPSLPKLGRPFPITPNDLAAQTIKHIIPAAHWAIEWPRLKTMHRLDAANGFNNLRRRRMPPPPKDLYHWNEQDAVKWLEEHYPLGGVISE